MPKKQKSGLYRARVKIGVGPDGKDLYKYISGKTKKELEEARKRTIEYYINGVSESDRSILFGAYMTEWYRAKREPNLSPGALYVDRCIVNKYIMPVFANRQIKAIRPLELQQYITDTLAGKSASRVQTVITNLYGVFESACRDGIIVHNPMEHIVRPPLKEKGTRRQLTPEERTKFEAATHDPDIGLMVALLYYLGCRRGEMLGLMWGDIDWKAGTVHIQRDIDPYTHDTPGALKTEKSNRIVPIPGKLLTLLTAKRGLPTSYIVATKPGKPMTNTQFVYRWKAMRKKYDIPEEITAHYLRHNYITMCWEAGIDVYATARFVGHSNVQTTLNIYTHLSEQRENESRQKVRDMFG